MKSQVKTLLRIAPAAVLILAFQNCSSPKFSQTSFASEKILSNDGTSVDTTPVVLPDVPAEPSEPASTTPTSNGGDQEQGRCEVEIPRKNPETIPTSSNDQAWRAACADLAKQAVSVADGASISNLSGSKSFQAKYFKNIDGNSGKTAILCNGNEGKISSVNENSGNLLICGCNIGEVKNKSGKLVVVGGDIGSLSNSSGVTVIDGKIGSVSNNSGAIKNH